MQESHPTTEVEILLTQLDDIQKTICSHFGGTIRLIVGDEILASLPLSV